MDSINIAWTKIKKSLGSRYLIVLVVIVAFVLAIIPLNSVNITEMGTGEFFFETVAPLSFWVSLIAIFCVLFYCILHLDFGDSKNVGIFIFCSIALMILMRSVFPLIFQNIITYEPDASNYLKITNSWLQNPIDFGKSGNYEHDYPLSFLIAFLFGKLGVPIELFFRFSPFFIYALDFILLYFIIKEITSDPKIGALGVFLFSISPLNYWLAVHFCPDLIGTLFFFLSLYLVIRLVNSKKISFLNVSAIAVSILALILTHHLSTLYFTVTMIGLAFSSWYFKSSLRDRSLYFLLIGIFTYTAWFVYGTLMYPEFFNVYTYFSQSGSAVTLSSQANLFQNFTFAVYPVFIVTLVLLYVRSKIGFRGFFRLFLSVPKIFHPSKFKIKLSRTMQYTSGYFLVFGLFLAGLAIPSIFAPRVLEILMIGLYPVASTYLLKLTSFGISRKKKIILFILILAVLLIDTHRYYSQIEGRVGAR